MIMNAALWLPLFDELADPRAVARLAAEAEEDGWHGVFVWDHLSWRSPVTRTADSWITLAAIATATEQVRLGPLVMAPPRRRPAKVVRESVTLDQLSRGRLTIGVGSDRFGAEPIGVDPVPYAAAGATWWLPEFHPETVTLDEVRGVINDGPLTS